MPSLTRHKALFLLVSFRRCGGGGGGGGDGDGGGGRT